MKYSSVSAVIPSHKRPALLERAVKSALAQTLPPLEVVVVLDGADSESEARLKAIGDGRIRVVSLSESRGGSEARNIGCRAAKGEWIALLDDDDEWFPVKLEKQLPFATASRHKYPIVASALLARTPSGESCWPRKPPRHPLSEYLFVRSSLFQGEGILQTSTLVTKRELLLEVPFTVGLRRHQDWDWILRAERTPGVGIEFVPEPLAVWNIDAPSSALKQYDWRFSLEWMRNNRNLLTPRAYAGLSAVTLSAQAAWQGDWKAFLPLLRETITGGKPRLMDLALFFAMWFVPRRVRHSMRSHWGNTPTGLTVRSPDFIQPVETPQAQF